MTSTQKIVLLSAILLFFLPFFVVGLVLGSNFFNVVYGAGDGGAGQQDTPNTGSSEALEELIEQLDSGALQLSLEQLRERVEQIGSGAPILESGDQLLSDDFSNTAPFANSGIYGVFGGQLRVVAQCTCNGGHVIRVGPPGIGTSNPLFPGKLRFIPGFSKLYEYKMIKKDGAWVLGTYQPPTLCLKLKCCSCGPEGGCCPCCKIIPHDGNIQIVGTSL